ncbi:MAG: hypothetical protein V3V00_15695 [Saprospiraceae bacterium]
MTDNQRLNEINQLLESIRLKKNALIRSIMDLDEQAAPLHNEIMEIRIKNTRDKTI